MTEDITATAVSDMSDSWAVKAKKSLVNNNISGVGKAQLGYEYELDPEVPRSFADCELLVDGVSVGSKSCNFFQGFFFDPLKDAVSGKYVVKVNGKKYSDWTFTRPGDDAIPTLRPSGCKIGKFTVSKKPTKVEKGDFLGKPTVNYTFRGKVTLLGNKKVCAKSDWTLVYIYEYKDEAFGGGSQTLEPNTKSVRIIKIDPTSAITGVDFKLTLATPGWRENVSSKPVTRMLPQR